MAAIANITVFDGAATPVSHTFTPISVSRKGDTVEAMWRELQATLPDYAQNRIEARITVLKSGTKKVEVKVVVPVMEAILNQNAAGYTAAPKVAFEDTEMWTSYCSPRSTINSRRLARMLLINMGNNITTSVVAATSGMFAELVDMLVAPT